MLPPHSVTEARPSLWLAAALTSVALASAGQILLKFGVRAALPPDFTRHPALLLGALSNPLILGGLLTFAVSMVFWLVAIGGQQMSSVYPLAALGYVVVSLLSVWLFDDTMSLGKIVGIALIVCGVIALTVSSRTPASPPAQQQVAANRAP